jgi:pyridoxal phosphate enzyme (YggS family)
MLKDRAPVKRQRSKPFKLQEQRHCSERPICRQGNFTKGKKGDRIRIMKPLSSLEIPKKILLVAAVKYASKSKMQSAQEKGVKVFGWSTLQHLRENYEHFKNMTHHFIGHIQRNKVKQLLAYPIELIHSVDSAALLKKINLTAKELGKKQKVLPQILTDEEKEHGFSLDEVRKILSEKKNFSNVIFEGLMTIPSPKSNPRTIYRNFRMKRDKLEKECGILLPHLSMGMSDDYKIAIEEGATMVRLGSILFEERK